MQETRIVSFSTTDGKLQLIDTLATKLGLSRSGLINYALDTLLKRYQFINEEEITVLTKKQRRVFEERLRKKLVDEITDELLKTFIDSLKLTEGFVEKVLEEVLPKAVKLAGKVELDD